MYVVIEACDLRGVLIQDSPRIVETEILKMDVCFRVVFSAGIDERLYKLVILVSRDALLSQTKVDIVLEETLVLFLLAKH